MAVIHETREEIIEILTALRKCKISIINGESASYTIGTRSVTFLNLKQVNDQIKEYEAKLEVLDGMAKLRSAKTVIPLDL